MLQNTLTPVRAGRACALGLLVLLAAGAPSAASAQTVTINSTIAPTSLDDPGTYPSSSQAIGTFSFNAPAFDTLTGATVSGYFGNSPFTPNTAPGVYSVGGVTVFTCNKGDACWGSDTETAWSYTFTAAQLTSLVAGASNVNQAENILFSVIQSDIGNVNIDTTTLSLTFAVPEPASLAMFGVGILGLGLIARRKRA